MIKNMQDYQHVFIRDWDVKKSNILFRTSPKSMSKKKGIDGIKIIKKISYSESNFIIHLLSLEEPVPRFYSSWLVENLTDREREEYLKRLQERNIQVLVTVGVTTKHYDSALGQYNLARYINHTVQHDPLFFLYQQFISTSQQVHAFGAYSVKRLLSKKKVLIDKLYMCLNGAPRPHRLLMLQALYENNLWNQGYISWLGNSKCYKSYHSDENLHRHYNNFGDWLKQSFHLPSSIKLAKFGYDIDMPNTYQNTRPPEIKKCLFHIVTETESEYFFLTEKTMMPLMFGKPFLVVGCKGFHTEYLKEYGFALHPEIDYSFDREDREEDRIAGIISQLKRFVDKDYGALYNQMYPVLSYNSRLVSEIYANTFHQSVTKQTGDLLKLYEPTDGPYSLKEMHSGVNKGTLYQLIYEKKLMQETLEKFRIDYTAHLPIRLRGKKIKKGFTL